MSKKEIKPRFNFEKIGTGEKKIVCIHGFGSSGKTFNDIEKYFDKSLYEMFMIDLIGFGDSKFVKNWNYTIEKQAELLYEFLKEKNLTDITLVGHSYGGGVVLLILILLNKLRNKDLVKNAVLIGPACYPQKIPFFIQIPAKYSFLYKIFMLLMSKKMLAKNMLKKLYINKTLITDEKIARYVSYFNKYDNINGIIQTAKNIVPENIDEIVSKIPDITLPVLIIWGENDFIIKKRNILRLNDDLSNVRLVIAENTGHVVQEEKPELVFNEIVKFTKD